MLAVIATNESISYSDKQVAQLMGGGKSPIYLNIYWHKFRLHDMIYRLVTLAHDTPWDTIDSTRYD